MTIVMMYELWIRVIIEFKNRMDNELECPLCNGEYSQENVPRLLTVCGHTFCHECLETLIVEEDDDTYRLQCPEDQNVVRL